MSNSLDTHCDGPGLSAFSPKPWSSWERTKRRYFNEYASELISTGFDRNSETLLNLSCLIFPTATYDLPTRVDLTGRWAIVSGGNSGIGRECARTLVSWNCNVILACRDPPPHEPHPDQVIKELKEMLAESSSKSAESKQPELEYWQIDYSSFKSVKAFAEKWLASGRTLYYLFNNAGLGSGGLNFIKTEDEFELTHQVNFLSHCLLTFMILPTMKQAKTPRIINTASAFHSDGDLDFSNFNNEKNTGTKNAYCNSKLLLVMFTKELQLRMSRTDDYKHVIVNSSNIWNTASVRALPMPILMVLDTIVKTRAISTRQGSVSMLHAAFDNSAGFTQKELSSRPPSKGESFGKGGKYFNRITEENPRPEVGDSLARSRLWQRVVEDVKAVENGWMTGFEGFETEKMEPTSHL